MLWTMEDNEPRTFWLGIMHSDLPTHLDADYNDQGCRRGDGEGLVIGQRFGGVLAGVGEDSVGDEEEHHGGVDALGDADEELPLVEEQVELAGLVQLGVLQAPPLWDILHINNTITLITAILTLSSTPGTLKNVLFEKLNC